MRCRALPYLVVLVASAWVTRHFWWPGHHVVSFDTSAYAAPNWAVGKKAFVDWRLPLLNDRIFAGVPHLGNPQSGAFSPLRWLSYAFQPTRAVNLLAAVHVLILGVGATFFGRRLGFSRLGATAVGLICVMGGATVTKSIQLEQIMVIAWLPWVLAFAHMVIAHPERWRYVGLLSTVVSMAILSGHPQMTYELAFTAAVFVVALVWRDANRWRALRSIGVAVATSALTCALTLLAALAASRDGQFASGRDIDTLNNGSLILQVRHVMQVFLGSVTIDRSDVFAGAFESIAYLGVVAGLLALAGVLGAVRRNLSRSWSVPLLVVAALGLVWSLGPRTPVFRAAFEYLPGFDQGRVSTRWLIVVSIIVAVFVGAGIDALREGPSRRVLLGVVGAVCASSTAMVVLPLRSGDGTTRVAWALAALLVVVSMWAARRVESSTRRRVAIAMLALLGLELLLLDRASIVDDVRSSEAAEHMGTGTTDFLESTDGYTIALTDDAGTADYLVPALRPNANALFDIASVDGYDGGVQVTTRWAASLRRFAVAPAYDLPLRNALSAPLDPTQMARLGVRWVLLDATDDPAVLVPGWDGPAVTDDRFSVWENPAWVAPAWAYLAAATTSRAAPDALRESASTFTNTAIVDRASAVLTCDSECDPRPVDLRVLTPEHLRTEVDLDRQSVVTVPRQALPGWSVSVDGERSELLTVDGLYLGVRVEPGPHVIEWRYRPGWVTPGTIAGILGVLVTLGLLWGRPLRWRRNRSGGPR